MDKNLHKAVIYVDRVEWEDFKKKCYPMSRSKVISAYIHMYLRGKNITLDDALTEILQIVTTPTAMNKARKVLQSRMK